MRFRKPAAPDPVIIQSLIALFDAIHSALHSLKNAVMVLPVMDSQGKEDLAAELSYCFSVENAEAVRAYGRSVQSLFKKLADQQPHVESALANFPPALSEQLKSTIVLLLDQGPEVAERIDRLGLHAQRFSTLDAMTPEEREAFLPYAKAHLDALYGLLADEEEGLLHRVSRALEPFEVGSILSAAARPVRARSQALGIQVEIPTVSKRLRLQSNPQPLTEVLDGLLSNALDAVMEQTKTEGVGNRGEIRVAVQDNDSAIEIRVTDNGCGLAPERLQSIRKGEHGTSKGKGRGNGLPSARQQLSGCHNASLDMESEGAGRGACAVVRLDLCKRTIPDESVTLRQRRTLLVAAAMATVLIAAGLSGRLTNPPGPSGASRSPREKQLDALYVTGRSHWNMRTISEFDHAINLFHQARKLDSNYALAYSGLADSYSLLSWHGGGQPNVCFEQARAYANEAVKRGPRLAETHTSLAWVYLAYDWDWVGAEREFKLALKYDSSYETAHHWYAILLATEGQFDEAMRELEKVKADPLPPIISTNVAKFLRFGGKSEAARKHLLKTLDEDPNFYRAYLELGLVYEQEKKFEHAIDSFRTAVDRSQSASRTLAALGHAYALNRDLSKAQEILAELQKRHHAYGKDAKNRYVSPYDVAVVYTGLNRKQEALDWLSKAVDEHASWLIYLNVEPMFVSYHSDPRFKKLLQRIRLEK